MRLKISHSSITLNKETKTVKQAENQFQTEKGQLKAKLAELSDQRRDQFALKVQEAADPFDQIQAAMERDVLVGLLNRDALLREELRRAFDSMESGTYGVCEDCEEGIAPARLKAIPWARCCVSCQEMRDREVNEKAVFPEAARRLGTAATAMRE
jgi:RNA polymerase-binding transcription factor DksA